MVYMLSWFIQSDLTCLLFEMPDLIYCNWDCDLYRFFKANTFVLQVTVHLIWVFLTNNGTRDTHTGTCHTLHFTKS